MKIIAKKVIAASLVAMALSTSAIANTGSDPASTYCSDLNSAIQQKMNASMQKRMPSSMPGDFMNDVFGVQELIDTKIDFGMLSPYSILQTLFDFAKNKITEGKRALLGEINSALGSVMSNTGIDLNMQSGSFSAGNIPVPTNGYSGGSVGSSAPSVSQPLSGTPVYQQEQAAPSTGGSSSSGGWASNFFRNLF